MGKKAIAKPINVTSHYLVPKHTKLSESEAKKFLEKYNISIKELPKILISDPAIANFDVKPGDIIKIDRASETAGKTVYYRGVING